MSVASDNSSEIEVGKLFVGGLSWNTTKESLKSYFSKFGEVSDSVIMVDPQTSKPRGFGFVTFSDPSSVGAVLNDPQEHWLDDKKIDPKQATMKPPLPKKVFVGGVATGTGEEDLKAYFSRFGDVTHAELKYDPDTKRMKGFGFVAFDSPDVAKKVCDMRHHEINGKTTEAKIAQTPSKARFSSNYQGTQGGYVGAEYGGNYPPQQFRSQPPNPQQQQGQAPYGYPSTYSYYYGAGQEATGYNSSAAGYNMGYGSTPQQPMNSYDNYSSYNTPRSADTAYHPPAQQYGGYQQQQPQQQPYGGTQAGHTGYPRSQPGYNNGYHSVRQ